MTARRWMAFKIVVAGLAILAHAGCSANRAEDFTLQSHDGESFTMSEVMGEQAVVLVFFTSWCEVCAQQVEPIKRFVDATAGDGVTVVGVSIQEEAATIADYVAAKELTYPVLLDAQAEVAKKYEIQGIPTIIGIDRAGRVVFREHAMPAEPAVLAGKLGAASA